MYELRPTTRFRRDIKRCKKRGWDLELLNAVYDILEVTGDLPDQYGAHPLRGEYTNCIDIHIASDWVLIYEVHEADKVIVLRRTGTHQDVFRSYR
jgi:mRNA interferase YafQ